MQDFPAFVREHVKNTGTKPVQVDSACEEPCRHHEQKNPGSAATETGIKSDTKASSLLSDNSSKVAIKAIGNHFVGPLMEAVMEGHSDTKLGSEILDTGKTPADWVEALATRGLTITERTLRGKANRLGACCKLGNAMIITGEQMDRILTEPEPCLSKYTNGKTAETTGFVAGSNSKGRGSRGHTGAAQAHLLRLAQKTG